MGQIYDGIIIGAGPNGLTVGAYLAKAGLKILILEKRFEMGGGLCTERVTIPGFLHDVHAIYHMMVEYAPPLKDFEFGISHDYKLRWIYPELQIVMPFEDGSYLALFADPEKSAETIRKFSQKDAESFLNFARASQEAMDIFLAPATYVNPLPSLEQAAKMEKHPLTKWLDELTGYSPKEIIDSWFEHDKVRTLFLYLATMWGIEYDMEGLGYLIPLMINRAWHFRLCEGGSHHLAHLLSKVIYRHGGMILTNQEVKRIIVENGEAKGVELKDGTKLIAKQFICSSLNPHQTFFELGLEDYIPEELKVRIREWKYSERSFFTLHFALFDAPKFKVAERFPELNKALLYVVGYESESDLISHFEAIRRGELIRSGFNCCFPSVHDLTRAPKGRHVGLISKEAPYRLKEGPQAWYKVRKEEEQRCLEVLNRYLSAPIEDLIMWDYIETPLDIENKFADMKQGCYKQGAYLPLQMGAMRPNEYCSDHSTPIRRLYMCGACTHSGGMITFGPGYCAAEKIADDLGIQKWWSEPEHVKKAKELGLL
ncbi:MAG: NAD(P)/FAD-dependent oxidoreductase [Nitrososphaerota archaeon]